MRKPERWIFGMLMVVLVPLEVACGLLAYETLGEITSALYLIATGVNLLFVLLAIRHPTAAAAGALILGLLIIPYQAILGDRLVRVQGEAARIVGYAYEERLAEGGFPADLTDYAFHDPAMRPYIQSYRSDETGGRFSLCFRVGTVSTSHCYTPELGWTYYPD